MGNDYKNSMNLPKTSFAMRAGLPQNEPKRLEWWAAQDIYQQILEKNKDGEPFVLHDGPPYANGPIHIGHAFNKILKDFVVKSHAQQGFFTPYIPGWDCHGQPIEHEVEKKLGTEKMRQLPQETVRRLCHEWAEKYVDIQREGFKRLGVNADWDNPYLTFTPTYESANVEVFKEMYLDGAVYRGRKPIHWCSHCKTALAEAEIEYGPETSPSIYVDFKLNNIPAEAEAAGVEVENAAILIWTTTPWTLPANTSVSLGPDFDYCFVAAHGVYHLMAYELVEKVAGVAGWEDFNVVAQPDGTPLLFKAADLQDLTYTCPIMQDRVGKVIWGDHVTLESGTGAVHTAGGHGVDDYLVSMKFGIDIVMPVDDDGVLMDIVPHFAGMSTDEANPAIIAWLDEQGVLVAHVDIDHSYPHCWRCHEPVIFRATDQWFVSMEKTGLREAALHEIHDEVRFVPEWGANRIGAMVADRPDWCISRQRSWGVPIPVFKCASCGETVATEETFDAVIDLFNKEGADAWFTRKPSEYLPSGTACAACGSSDIVPEKDILDVWWESGVSHVGVLEHRAEQDNLTWPADMYLEGSDQHRGWFQSSLLCGIGSSHKKAPYKSVMCCGFTVDENGRKMSKSLGNGIDPKEVTDKYGADVLRLWVASTDYSVDVSIGDTILERTSDAYRRFRNTFRFLLGNLHDFDREKDAVAFDDLLPIDKWALLRLSQLLESVTDSYNNFLYHKVYRALYDYVVSDLSAVYMDVIKDRLYSDAPEWKTRRSAQTALMAILDTLVRVMSPILSFTTEEVWEHYPEAELARTNRPISVQLAGWPQLQDYCAGMPTAEAAQAHIGEYEALLEVRDAVTAALEEKRSEGSLKKSQEAHLRIYVDSTRAQALSMLSESDLEEFFIVSGVDVEVHDAEDIVVEVELSTREKCPRCWNYRDLGVVSTHEDVCERCAHVLQDMGE